MIKAVGRTVWCVGSQCLDLWVKLKLQAECSSRERCGLLLSRCELGVHARVVGQHTLGRCSESIRMKLCQCGCRKDDEQELGFETWVKATIVLDSAKGDDTCGQCGPAWPDA